MKKKFLFAFPLFLLVLTGCAQHQLKTGQYLPAVPGREDQICVFEDYIFLKIKTPEDSPDNIQYWLWAGKYSVNEQGNIVFDMDKLTWKKWNFYFSFILKHGMIEVKNQGDSQAVVLKLSPIKKRHGSKPAQQNAFPAF